MVAPLSTTTMIGLLNRGDLNAFIEMVTKHFSDSESDEVSASKVINTVASFSYKNNIPSSSCPTLLPCLVRCSEVLASSSKEKEQREAYSSLYHVMVRLTKQELLGGAAALAPAFLSLESALPPGTVTVRLPLLQLL